MKIFRYVVKKFLSTKAISYRKNYSAAGSESWSQRGISILKCSVSQRPKTNAMLTYLLNYVITQGDFTLQNEEIEDIVSPVILSVQAACTVKAQQSLGLLKETQSEGEKFSQQIKYKTFLVAVLFMKKLRWFLYSYFISFISSRKIGVTISGSVCF